MPIHEAYRNIHPHAIFQHAAFPGKCRYDEVDVNVTGKIEVRFRRCNWFTTPRATRFGGVISAAPIASFAVAAGTTVPQRPQNQSFSWTAAGSSLAPITPAPAGSGISGTL